MADLDGALALWRASGHYCRIDGVDVWCRTEGEGPWLVCLHGFPTSSRDYVWLLPLLRGHFRVLLFDLPGFGLSGKPRDRDYSLVAQFAVLEGLLREHAIDRCHLLAHDMGDTLACEGLRRLEDGATALRPDSITLLNGGLYMDLHRPLLTQRLLRIPGLRRVLAGLSQYPLFRSQYRKIHSDSDLFGEDHYLEQWQLLRCRGGLRVLPDVAGYMRERIRMGDRWLGPLHRCALPMQLVWGLEDPVAVPAIAQRLAQKRPQTTLVELEGVGHYPQLEAPERVAAAVVRFAAGARQRDGRR